MNKLISPLFVFKNPLYFYFDYLHLLRRKRIQYKLYQSIQLDALVRQADGLIINEVWGMHVYDPDKFEIKEKDIVVDIGGHKGYFAVYAALKARKGKVFSFEPLKLNYEFIQRNIKLNKIKNIKPFKLGVSGQNGKQMLYVDLTSSASVTTLTTWLPKEYATSEAEFITMKDVFLKCNITKIDFLKVDCEGAEFEIFFNTPKSIFKKIKKISMEFHQVNKRFLPRLIKVLQQNNFEVEVKDEDLPIGMLYAQNKNVNSF